MIVPERDARDADGPLVDEAAEYDLAIIGGGINGSGIARDAAGRGLRVLLCEQDDLGSHTSSASSKLIHGGLRYLEHGALGMVRAALLERERLLRCAPHVIRPLSLVIPDVPAPGRRSRWLVRLGLLVYDALGGLRRGLPRSRAIDLYNHPAGAPLRGDVRHGFAYFDCQAQDARLVVLNAMDAAAHGAAILTRTVCRGAHRERGGWRLKLEQRCGDDGGASRREFALHARALVNAAGPWAGRLMKCIEDVPSPDAGVHLVAGSHIVVNRLFEHPHGYLLQHEDGRVIFVLPWERSFTLIGTTERAFHGDPAQVKAERAEVEYLCDAVNHYFEQALRPEDVVWSFAGVRLLYDDAHGDDMSAMTREYSLRLDTGNDGQGAPLLTLYGGKLTTFRKLAEDALARLCPLLGVPDRRWTAGAALPGGDLGGLDIKALHHKVLHDLDFLPRPMLDRWVYTYGGLVYRLAEGVTGEDDLGLAFGDGLYQREVDYLREHEWAQRADDILWRRTRLGLEVSQQTVANLERYLEE